MKLHLDYDEDDDNYVVSFDIPMSVLLPLPDVFDRVIICVTPRDLDAFPQGGK